MVPRSVGGEHGGGANIVIICANCHAILTRATNVIEKHFVKFLKSKQNPYYPLYTTREEYERLSITIKVEIMRRFYKLLREKWGEILKELKQHD